jgi:hypothetical protein
MAVLRHVSHPQLCALADWACNEPCTLHTSQISLLRNNRTSMLGTKAIDALGRVNQVAWVAQHHPRLLPQLGSAPLTPLIERILAVYQPLLDPVSQEPLGSGAFLEIYLGVRRLPLALPRVLSPEEANRLAECLGDWLEEQIRAAGLSYREAGRRLRLQWSGTDPGAKRLVRVLAGLEDYSGKQLASEWELIGSAICALLDREPDVWLLADEILAGVRGKAKMAGKGSRSASASLPPRRTGAASTRRTRGMDGASGKPKAA